MKLSLHIAVHPHSVSVSPFPPPPTCTEFLVQTAPVGSIERGCPCVLHTCFMSCVYGWLGQSSWVCVCLPYLRVDPWSGQCLMTLDPFLWGESGRDIITSQCHMTHSAVHYGVTRQTNGCSYLDSIKTHGSFAWACVSVYLTWCNLHLLFVA